jgi:hypothetical protein
MVLDAARELLDEARSAASSGMDAGLGRTS